MVAVGMRLVEMQMSRAAAVGLIRKKRPERHIVLKITIPQQTGHPTRPGID